MTIRYYDLPCANLADVSKPDALWRMAHSDVSAATLILSSGTTWIALDPGMSSPNALIGVVIHNGRTCLLTPGRVIPIGRGIDRVRIYNAAFLAGGGDGVVGVPPGAVGRGAIAGGTSDDLPAYLAGLQTPERARNPKLDTICVGNNPIADASVVFSAHNLSAIRVGVYGIDVNGNAINPADFALTLTPKYHLFGGAGGVGGVGSGGLGGDMLGPDVPYGTTATLAQYEDPANVMTFTQAQKVRSIPIMPSMDVALVASAAAGTGVSRVIVTVVGVK